MTHESVHEAFLGLFEGTLAPDEKEQVERHLNECAECRRALTHYARICRLEQTLAGEKPQARSIAAQVMNAIEEHEAKKLPQILAAWLNPKTWTAAAVVCSACVALILAQRQPPDAIKRLTQESVPSEAHISEEAKLAPIPAAPGQELRQEPGQDTEQTLGARTPAQMPAESLARSPAAAAGVRERTFREAVPDQRPADKPFADADKPLAGAAEGSGAAKGGAVLPRKDFSAMNEADLALQKEPAVQKKQAAESPPATLELQDAGTGAKTQYVLKDGKWGIAGQNESKRELKEKNEDKPAPAGTLDSVAASSFRKAETFSSTKASYDEFLAALEKGQRPASFRPEKLINDFSYAEGRGYELARVAQLPGRYWLLFKVPAGKQSPLIEFDAEKVKRFRSLGGAFKNTSEGFVADQLPAVGRGQQQIAVYEVDTVPGAEGRLGEFWVEKGAAPMAVELSQAKGSIEDGSADLRFAAPAGFLLEKLWGTKLDYSSLYLLQLIRGSLEQQPDAERDRFLDRVSKAVRKVG